MTKAQEQQVDKRETVPAPFLLVLQIAALVLIGVVATLGATIRRLGEAGVVCDNYADRHGHVRRHSFAALFGRLRRLASPVYPWPLASSRIDGQQGRNVNRCFDSLGGWACICRGRYALSASHRIDHLPT